MLDCFPTAACSAPKSRLHYIMGDDALAWYGKAIIPLCSRHFQQAYARPRRCMLYSFPPENKNRFPKIRKRSAEATRTAAFQAASGAGWRSHAKAPAINPGSGSPQESPHGLTSGLLPIRESSPGPRRSVTSDRKSAGVPAASRHGCGQPARILRCGVRRRGLEAPADAGKMPALRDPSVLYAAQVVVPC